ncbi:glycoside hydrolase family 15 protein [Erwiniaceae bacterium BAC15a-03b]|uniref:Glycoside hydrolase family 15 protein n=1 Tax=Winslowiella arboricola TaxID=2978220 RepID=A0A9J6PXW1_9GAMM|nr:glycoside hydrolase family 15 protein [Winslowiella arboricola]MCU5775299.1 glycoside hydrolase family 15 protein [Winslowiella arboricola]MCU5780304.1 glycoside hydrolase family 15 protein [Winslowiella arboricola]
MKNKHYRSPVRKDGFAGLGDYAAIGEGRSVALIAPDGAIDWWCAPNLDSQPLFDRILDTAIGGFFQLEPSEPYSVTRHYREQSNVLETRFETESGSVLLTESINSTLAGRLPWSELARRVEGLKGHVELNLRLRFGTAAETRSPWMANTAQGNVFHIAEMMAMLRTSDDIEITHCEDEQVTGLLTTAPGSRSLVALLVTEKEPLAVPALTAIDERIETSHIAWCDWAKSLSYQGRYATQVMRSALALKFLWYSPTGALAAAATTSLPEGIGGEKNYDYRYAWVRDACLIIKAFVYLGALEDCKAAFSWLSKTIIRHGVRLHACYTLEGEVVPEERYPDLQGYQHSQPVRVGNNARDQLQLSMYGDMLATAQLFIEAGHILDLATSRMLGELANCCADHWRQKDSGIWELPENQHYTHSKMACWLALDRAVAMANEQHIEPTWVGRWQRERDRIRDWVETHCWSESKQAYLFYPGSEDKLDAALALVHHYGNAVNRQRMLATLQAIIADLGHGTAMLYRYSNVEKEESTFVACAFWLVEALASMGEAAQAETHMKEIIETLCGEGNVETFNEMFDVRTNSWRGNIPQGLSHLALICASQALTATEK